MFLRFEPRSLMVPSDGLSDFSFAAPVLCRTSPTRLPAFGAIP
jgi:hypothetical protein